MLRYIYEKGQRFWAKIQDNCSLFLDATDGQKLTFNHVIWTLTLPWGGGVKRRPYGSADRVK